jgi:hypothetical protein
MGDPGLHSKFIEMQQEDEFMFHRQDEKPNPYLESLRLHRSRILQQLDRATHPYHIQILQRSLRHVENQIK